MKGQIAFILILMGAFSLSAVEIQKVEKIEKYMGSCEIVDYDVRAHLTYVSETGYQDGYSNKGVIVEFSNEKGKLVQLSTEIKRLTLTGFEKEVKIKNRWNKFTVDKDRNRFGGSDGEIKIHKIKLHFEKKFQNFKKSSSHPAGSVPSRY